MLIGKALEKFNETNNKKNLILKDYVDFFRTLIPIQESKWYDSHLKEEVKAYIIKCGDLDLYFYNEVDLICKLNDDYNQEFNRI